MPDSSSWTAIEICSTVGLLKRIPYIRLRRVRWNKEQCPDWYYITDSQIEKEQEIKIKKPGGSGSIRNTRNTCECQEIGNTLWVLILPIHGHMPENYRELLDELMNAVWFGSYYPSWLYQALTLLLSSPMVDNGLGSYCSHPSAKYPQPNQFFSFSLKWWCAFFSLFPSHNFPFYHRICF